jgi:hypothetical protein
LPPISEGREAIRRRVERQVLKAVQIAETRRDYESRLKAGGTVEDLHALVASGKSFGAILGDLPWLFHAHSGKVKQWRAERYYDCMSLDDIEAYRRSRGEGFRIVFLGSAIAFAASLRSYSAARIRIQISSIRMVQG